MPHTDIAEHDIEALKLERVQFGTESVLSSTAFSEQVLRSVQVFRSHRRCEKCGKLCHISEWCIWTTGLIGPQRTKCYECMFRGYAGELRQSLVVPALKADTGEIIKPDLFFELMRHLGVATKLPAGVVLPDTMQLPDDAATR